MSAGETFPSTTQSHDKQEDWNPWQQPKDPLSARHEELSIKGAIRGLNKSEQHELNGIRAIGDAMVGGVESAISGQERDAKRKEDLLQQFELGGRYDEKGTFHAIEGMDSPEGRLAAEKTKQQLRHEINDIYDRIDSNVAFSDKFRPIGTPRKPEPTPVDVNPFQTAQPLLPAPRWEDLYKS